VPSTVLSSFKWDESTPKAYHYTIDGSKVSRKTGGGFPQIVSLESIKETTKITFKSIYAVKVTASIAFGLLA
jgi:hypothetical protein